MNHGVKLVIKELKIMKINHTRHKKRLQNRHKSLRRMAFYAEENSNVAKPFRCYSDRQNKVIGE